MCIVVEHDRKGGEVGGSGGDEDGQFGGQLELDVLRKSDSCPSLCVSADYSEQSRRATSTLDVTDDGT